MSKSSFDFKVDLIGKLDDQLLSHKNDGRLYRAPSKRPHLYPTEASVQWEADNGMIITEGSCLRAIWYRLNGYEVTDEPIPRLHWVWKAGEDWENHCNRLAYEAGMLAAKNIKVQDRELPLTVSGEIDAVNYYDDDDGKRHMYVIDYKSTGGSYYNQVKLMGNTKNKPFPKVENLLQLMVYMHIDERLEFGMLAYLIRDKMDRTQFQIDLNTTEDGLKYAVVNGEHYPKYSVNEIYRRYMMVCDYYDRNVLPPKDYTAEYTMHQAELLNEIGQLSDSALKKHKTGRPKDKQGHWRCSYCSFRKQCDADGDT